MAITQGTAMWAAVLQPVANFNRDGFEYSINVQLDNEEANKLRNAGLTVADKDGIPTIRFKLPQLKRDGSKNEPPRIVDKDNMPYSGPGIGNGSKVKVKFRTYDWEFGRKKGIGTALEAVQVIDLVPYNKGGDNEDFEPVTSNSPF